MGMLVTSTEEKLCVELDSGARKEDYLPYIGSFQGTPSTLAFKISDSLINPIPFVSKAGYLNAFGMKDPILISGDPIQTLPFATADIFGYCDNESSP